MAFFAVLAATWPAAELRRLGPWTLRRGAGGGQRVSAATLDGQLGDIAEAEAAMAAWGQDPLFMVRPGEAALDAALDARGYTVRDRTVFLAGPAATLAAGAVDSVVYCAAPLAVMREIWARAGVGPERLAVMARAVEPRVWLLARSGDRPAGCAFVAVHAGVAMMHALEIAPEVRRQGLARAMTRAAAAWGVGHGAERLALAVTQANAPALALYRGLGMAEAGRYHYRARA